MIEINATNEKNMILFEQLLGRVFLNEGVGNFLNSLSDDQLITLERESENPAIYLTSMQRCIISTTCSLERKRRSKRKSA